MIRAMKHTPAPQPVVRPNIALLMVGALLAGVLLIADSPGWAEPPSESSVLINFDDLVPGDAPKPWGRSWGDPGFDTLVVSNLASVSRQNSLLLARDGDPAHWGAAMPLPEIADQWMGLSFALRIEGSGVDARFHFEVRGDKADERMYSFGFGNRFGERLAVFRNEASGQSLKLGEYKPGQWYLVQAWLPTAHGESDVAAAQLFERGEDGESWVASKARQALPGVRPDRRYDRFMVSTHPGERKFRLYLDDIAITSTRDRLPDDTDAH